MRRQTFYDVLDPSGFSQKSGTACKSRLMQSSPTFYRIPRFLVHTPALLCNIVIFC